MILILACSGCKSFKKSSPSAIDTLFTDTGIAEEPIDSAALYEALDSYRVESEPPVQQPVMNVSGNRYYMIVGCFAVPRNAEMYAAKIQGLGYNTSIIPGNNNLQMVAARSYSTYQESIAEIEKFRTEVTPDAWVYVRR